MRDARRPRLRCGIDIGGTFTDIVLFDAETGSVTTEKVLTTPIDPSEAVMTGVKRLLARMRHDVPPTGSFVHATTLVTNALIERKGSRTALVCTKGFRDVLDLRRANRYDIFDLALERPDPLVVPELRWELAERMSAEGVELLPLDDQEIRALAAEMRAAGVEAVAIVLLHAYEYDAHEKAVARLLERDLPSAAICRSSEVAPQIREYERMCTTVVNAYVMPLMERYLERMSMQVEEVVPNARLSMMISDGGTCSIAAARRYPVRLLESGPAAGVLAAQYYGALAGERNVLAFDMGGTTAKLCILRDGEPTMTEQFEAARVSRFQKGSGIPVLIPSIDLVEIGAGGGSVAYVDELGLLQVGPRSAGSSPGPACYGFGGREPTVTDADLSLGYLDPDHFLGGQMRLDLNAGVAAIRTKVAEPLQLYVERASWGIHDVVNENMAIAARLHLASAGLDPRTFSLVVTGGAGPLHGLHLAAKLGIRHLICPPSPGVASAFGLLVAPTRSDVSRSFLSRLDVVDWRELNGVLQELSARATGMLDAAGASSSSIARVARMSYVGQTHQIEVDLPCGELNSVSLPKIRHAFDERYKELYGQPVADAVQQIVGLRVTVRGPTPDAPRLQSAALQDSEGPEKARSIRTPGGDATVDVPVRQRRALRRGVIYKGPAIVEDPDSALVVDAGWDYFIDEHDVVHVTDMQAKEG